MTPDLWPKNDQKVQGGTSRKIWWGCAACFLKPLPYFRPKSVIFPTLFQTRNPGALHVTGARDKLLWHVHVVGVNIKKEMVLLPNNEEVANSSKKHTQFKTRVRKPYPISDQNGWKTIPFGTIRDYPPGQKTRHRLWVSLLAQARLIRDSGITTP